MSRLSEDVSYFIAVIQGLTTDEQYNPCKATVLLTDEGKKNLLKVLELARKELGK